MRKIFLQNGYSKHLRRQFAILVPSHIVSIDRPSEAAANRYQEECDPDMRVTYYTRSYSAESERLQTLEGLSRMYSHQG